VNVCGRGRGLWVYKIVPQVIIKVGKEKKWFALGINGWVISREKNKWGFLGKEMRKWEWNCYQEGGYDIIHRLHGWLWWDSSYLWENAILKKWTGIDIDFITFWGRKKKRQNVFFLNLSSPKGKEIGRCEYGHVSISSFQECLMRCYINRRWYRTENYDYVGINNFFWQMRIYLLF